MKGFALLGIVLIVVGLLSFLIPIPRRESHGVKIGDAKIGVQTESKEKMPPAVGLVLIAGGVVTLVAGTRRG